MTRRVVAILNPVSGRRNMLPAVSRVGRILAARDGHLEVAVTDGVGHATELARQVPADAAAVLAIGGDGTVSEVVNGLIGRNTPIVIWATGTENLLARELSMPDVPEDVARLLLEGRPFSFDVGVIDDRHFLAMAGIGFDAECVSRMSGIRRGHITHWDYFWPIWRTFWAHRFPVLRVEADGVCVFEDRGLAIVGVIRRYSAGMRFLADARYDDGLLDVCVMPCASRSRLLLHGCRALTHCHVGRGGIICCRGRRIRVSSPQKVPVQLDGEVGGELPADLSILPGAARFLRLASRTSKSGWHASTRW